MLNYSVNINICNLMKQIFRYLKASEECSVGSIPIIYAGGALLFLSYVGESHQGAPYTTIQKFENIVCCLCTLSNIDLKCVVHAFLMNFIAATISNTKREQIYLVMAR